jgi:hypothetical protein
MKVRYIFFLILIVLIILTGCSSAETPQEASEDASVTPASESAYPLPAYPVPAYPAPAYPGPELSGSNPSALYPDIASGATVPWDQAVEMLNNGEVWMVRVKGQPVEVTLGLIDGRELYSSADGQSVVVDAIRNCAACGSITFFQE